MKACTQLHDSVRPDRRRFFKVGSLLGAAWLLTAQRTLLAQPQASLEVASAGSLRAMLNGPFKEVAAQTLGLDLHSHVGGADTVARSILDGSLAADVFLPITASPMRMVLEAGKARVAYPFASTELVMLYSPKSRFAKQFAAAAHGEGDVWSVLQEPGLRLARSNPLDDPSGRAVLFSTMLAARRYHQPGLVQKVLGETLNPAQIRPGVDIRAALEEGTLDAAGSYRIATRSGAIPFVPLPPDINLSDPTVQQVYPDLTLKIAGKLFRPEPLIFYAAQLQTARNPAGAERFLAWLQGHQAIALLKAQGFNVPEAAERLAPLAHSC